jgi:hypothetical protein
MSPRPFRYALLFALALTAICAAADAASHGLAVNLLVGLLGCRDGHPCESLMANREQANDTDEDLGLQRLSDLHRCLARRSRPKRKRAEIVADASTPITQCALVTNALGQACRASSAGSSVPGW